MNLAKIIAVWIIAISVAAMATTSVYTTFIDEEPPDRLTADTIFEIGTELQRWACMMAVGTAFPGFDDAAETYRQLAELCWRNSSVSLWMPPAEDG